MTLLVDPLSKAGIDVRSWTAVAIMMGVSVLSGWLLYRLVELPFMRLRDKYFATAQNESPKQGLLPRSV
jgi:peptidoglycan/LPS O-acetylase OafA/YrhL